MKVSAASLPVIIGGDFNLIRVPVDKNNARIDIPGKQRSNDWIPDLGLRELDRVGAQFTWTNQQLNPTRSVLDRVLVFLEWELRFPLACLQAITRTGSNHAPSFSPRVMTDPHLPRGSASSLTGSGNPGSLRR